jgi:hypothetical protein
MSYDRARMTYAIEIYIMAFRHDQINLVIGKYVPLYMTVNVCDGFLR